MTTDSLDQMAKDERLGCLYLTFLNRPSGLSFEQIRSLMPMAYRGEPESARRKFERDKNDLQKLGLWLRHFADGEVLPDGRTATGHVYIPEQGFHWLGDVKLSEKQRNGLANILARSLQRESSESVRNNLTSLYIKLFYNNLPDSEVRETDGLSESEPLESQILSTVQEALLQKKKIQVNYAPASGKVEDRILESRGLLFYRGRWCLVAYCAATKDNRYYYLERMQSVRLLDEAFKPEKGFNLKDYSLHPLSIRIHDPVEIDLKIHEIHRPAFENFLTGYSRAKAHGGGFRIQCTNERALFRWLLQRPESLQSLDPDSAARFEEFLKEIKELYQ
ncbi:MAG: WYL domain-containing protein [Leptospiraceae bacterium]|nr:WYL domain-containing protein [Leptospiraceae bacterium]